jgi:hypothetical protein
MNKSKILLCAIACLLAGNLFAGDKNIKADGTFIQAGLCGSWTDEEWQEEFRVMKEAGMHYLVIGAVAESYKDEKVYTLYPSKLENTVLNRHLNGKDMVDICLRNAEECGIKVFIGMGMSEKWWNAPGIDSTWLYNRMEFDNKVMDEVWERYHDKYPNAFYGWDWVYEVANVKLTEAQINVLVKSMNIQLDHMNVTGKKLPFMWCPFMNSKLGTAQQYRDFWIYVFSKIHTTPGDIFAPQDCVGAGGLQLSEVDEWFAELKKAADTKPGLKYWSDVETFDHTDWSSATLDRVIKQVEIEKPYVENYITFAYSHYNSPYSCNTGFHKTYLDYLKNGELDNISPASPSVFNISINVEGQTLLTWSPASDNIGVCGYTIFRDGQMIYRKQVEKEDEGKSDLITMRDKGLTSGTTYTYELRAFDFANNISEPVIKEVTIP